jgi:carboxynorspermidine decarboxylase
MEYDLDKLKTPCYLIDLGLLEKNLQVLKDVQNRTGCKILLAQKGYAAWSTYCLCSQYLAGTAASSLHEAKLGAEYFPGEVHLCAPAYRDDEMEEYLRIVDHIVFNSFAQWNRYRVKVRNAPKKIACGLRINPMHSEVRTKIYDPCAARSRLGIPIDQFKPDTLDGITGLHFHTLCELNADSLQRTLPVVEKQFGETIKQMDWINFGGGHHMTRADYDVDLLCKLITDFQQRYTNLKTIYLEPGEAIALNTGVLVASVLDIVHNEVDIAILGVKSRIPIVSRGRLAWPATWSAIIHLIDPSLSATNSSLVIWLTTRWSKIPCSTASTSPTSSCMTHRAMHTNCSGDLPMKTSKIACLEFTETPVLMVLI